MSAGYEVSASIKVEATSIYGLMLALDDIRDRLGDESSGYDPGTTNAVIGTGDGVETYKFKVTLR